MKISGQGVTNSEGCHVFLEQPCKTPSKTEKGIFSYIMNNNFVYWNAINARHAVIMKMNTLCMLQVLLYFHMAQMSRTAKLSKMNKFRIYMMFLYTSHFTNTVD